MHIQIDLPRPGLTALLAAAIIGGAVYVQLQSEAAALPPVPAPTPIATEPATPAPAAPMIWPQPYGYYPPYLPSAAPAGQSPFGSPWTTSFASPYGSPTLANPTYDAEQIRLDAERRVAEEKLRLQIVSEREDILRNQLKILESDMKRRGSNITQSESERFRQSVRELTSLLQDETRSEEFLLSSYRQIEQARADLIALTEHTETAVQSAFSFIYPLAPRYGISAYFHDPSYPYSKQIGAHEGIDIPAEQGTEIVAVGPGIVVKAADNGYGYNSIIVQHPDGRSSLVGHVSKILVEEGQAVAQGQVIALSGGEPGTRGAGAYTTGAHVHFEIYENGRPVDPMGLLPALRD